ncbi:unnamed protein product, partial [Symbiodinium sp. CCMP2456]
PKTRRSSKLHCATKRSPLSKKSSRCCVRTERKRTARRQRWRSNSRRCAGRCRAPRTPRRSWTPKCASWRLCRSAWITNGVLSERRWPAAAMRRRRKPSQCRGLSTKHWRKVRSWRRSVGRRSQVRLCLDRAEKLEQMRKIMDEQELEMSQKIERVQQYVKERQTTAIMAEKKQQDAEKMAERWQNEVRRCQAEKERLAAAVLDMEGRQSGQAQQMQGAVDQHRRQVTALEDALRRKEDQMREQNLELLSRRDEEYQAKVALEKQREKERSIALLKKKEQEVHIKDQQLRAAKQRIQELLASSHFHAPEVGHPESEREYTCDEVQE